jgi:serine/threonine protein kinase
MVKKCAHAPHILGTATHRVGYFIAMTLIRGTTLKEFIQNCKFRRLEILQISLVCVIVPPCLSNPCLSHTHHHRLLRKPLKKSTNADLHIETSSPTTLWYVCVTSASIISSHLSFMQMSGVENDLKVVICDFGLACPIRRSPAERAGTMRFMPPEVLLRQALNDAEVIDVYAIGCIIWCLASGETSPHNSASNHTEVLQAIQTRPLSCEARAPIQQIIANCTRYEYRYRWTLEWLIGFLRMEVAIRKEFRAQKEEERRAAAAGAEPQIKQPQKRKLDV